MLRGAWTRRRKQECEPALRRYFLSRKRKRGHRETEQRVWLEAKLITNWLADLLLKSARGFPFQV